MARGTPLDKSQRQFCTAPSEHTRLLAPAGCGKTLCLLHRCVSLSRTAEGPRPRFLVVTFTRAARDELASRLAQDPSFASIRDQVEVATLNSWGYRRIANIAFSAKLITSSDQYHFTMKNQLQPIWAQFPTVAGAIKSSKGSVPRTLMEQMDTFKALGFDHTRHKTKEAFRLRASELLDQGLGPHLDRVLDQLVRLKVLQLLPEGKRDSLGLIVPFEKVHKDFYRFWCLAVEHLIQSATFTLEDQKYVAYLDERSKLEQGKFLSGATHYDHVLVDEFQDINPLDLALIKVIAERSRATLTVVGDDDQAIFEWRGATPEYVLDPTRHLGVSFETYTLAVNYRAPRNIVKLSQRLIAHNSRRVAKKVRAARDDDADIAVIRAPSLDAATDAVWQEVAASLAGKDGSAKLAIIGRKKCQIIPYQVLFASRQVPFCAAEDLQIFLSAAFGNLLDLLHIKDMATQRQPSSKVTADVLAMCNLVRRYPLSKGDATGLNAYLGRHGPGTTNAAVDVLRAYTGPLKGDNADGRMSRQMAEAISEFLEAHTVSEALREMGAQFQGLQYDLGKAEDDVFYTDPPFLYLADYAARYGSDYSTFVADIELAKQQLVYLPPLDEDALSQESTVWGRPVHLMTALRAKGKEFDTVVLLDANEGIWPSRRATTDDELEAERRLFYVAITRARSRLVIIVNDSISSSPALPSRYLAEAGL
jgi:DNA helicase-2/ATP-dependent DNA helicase PcrA